MLVKNFKNKRYLLDGGGRLHVQVGRSIHYNRVSDEFTQNNPTLRDFVLKHKLRRERNATLSQNSRYAKTSRKEMRDIEKNKPPVVVDARVECEASEVKIHIALCAELHLVPALEDLQNEIVAEFGTDDIAEHMNLRDVIERVSEEFERTIHCAMTENAPDFCKFNERKVRKWTKRWVADFITPEGEDEGLEAQERAIAFYITKALSAKPSIERVRLQRGSEAARDYKTMLEDLSEDGRYQSEGFNEDMDDSRPFSNAVIDGILEALNVLSGSNEQIMEDHAVHLARQKENAKKNRARRAAITVR